LHQTSTTLARQPFGLAADDYVTARKLELAPASQAKEKQLLVSCGLTSNRNRSRRSRPNGSPNTGHGGPARPKN
jgi:hypothetical protein